MSTLPRILMSRDLKLMAAHHSVFCLWSLVTDHTAEEVLAPDYFNAAKNVLQPLDRIEVSCEVDTGAPKHMRLIVNAMLTRHGRVALRHDRWVEAAKARGLDERVPYIGVEVAPLDVYWQPPAPAVEMRAA